MTTKKYTILLTSKKIKIKLKMKYQIKIVTISSAGEDLEQMKHTLLVDMNNYTGYLEKSLEISCKANHLLTT